MSEEWQPPLSNTATTPAQSHNNLFLGSNECLSSSAMFYVWEPGYKAVSHAPFLEPRLSEYTRPRLAFLATCKLATLRGTGKPPLQRTLTR